MILNTACPRLGVLPWQTVPGETIPKFEISVVGVESRNIVGIVDHVIAATNSHSIEKIVELHSHLGIHSLAKEEFLPNRQCFAAFKRISEARIEWSGGILMSP